MKRAILAILMAGLFSAAYAQDRALLFEVSGNGLQQSSYLFGTFHMLCPADLQLTDSTRTALSVAERLYLEIDVHDPALMANMMTAMTLSGGQNLRDFLTPGDYAALDAYMRESLGAGLTQMGILKPIALLSAMLGSILECEPVSYDLTLADMAAQEGKEIFGLETLEQQMALFDTVPLDEQVKGLVDMAREPDAVQAEIRNLISAYKAQDLPLLMKLASESQFDGGFEGFQEELLDARNSNWISVIEKAVRETSTFFAFGAAHLGGANGVVSLLREKGYTVRPMQ